MTQDNAKNKSHYERISISGVNYSRLIYGPDAMKKMTSTKTEGEFVKVLSNKFLTHKETRQVYKVG